MQIGKNQLKLCRYGWMLFSGPYIGKCFELYGQYSEAEVRVIRTFVKPGDTALDIGANIGDLTLPMARCAGETGRVHAFESHIENYHLLCANLALNGITNVRALNAFVATSDRVNPAGPWGEYGYVSSTWGTSFLAIDALELTSCSFIKIDVDGAELDVLRSAAATVARLLPVIYCENEDRQKSPALLEYLMSVGYDLYWHQSAIFEADNFFGNPVNHWAPQNIVSRMILALPRGEIYPEWHFEEGRALPRLVGGIGRQVFFFEKKNQKNFYTSAGPAGTIPVGSSHGWLR